MFLRCKKCIDVKTFIVGIAILAVIAIFINMKALASISEWSNPVGDGSVTLKNEDVNHATRFYVSNQVIKESRSKQFCTMYSSAYKNLVRSKLKTNLKEWKYDKTIECPKLVISDGLNDSPREKYSLDCSTGTAKLVLSFTNKSDDIQITQMNNPCLAAFIENCCNDRRGIPHVVHYVWYFRLKMKFYLFLSMMSVIRYLRPCLILFHGAFLPYGKYWDYIIRKYPYILHVKRPRPKTIYGKQIRVHQHSGDIMRLEALQSLGGIYFDADIIILRDLEPLRDHDVTLCYQASGYLLNAFIMAKKNASFLELWMDGYRKHYNNLKYGYNSMKYNKELAQKRRDLIHIENGTLCSPQEMFGKALDPNSVYNWSSLYGYHMSIRTFYLPWNEDWIKSFNTTLGSMLRHVLYGNKELCV